MKKICMELFSLWSLVVMHTCLVVIHVQLIELLSYEFVEIVNWAFDYNMANSKKNVIFCDVIFLLARDFIRQINWTGQGCSTKKNWKKSSAQFLRYDHVKFCDIFWPGDLDLWPFNVKFCTSPYNVSRQHMLTLDFIYLLHKYIIWGQGHIWAKFDVFDIIWRNTWRHIAKRTLCTRKGFQRWIECSKPHASRWSSS